MVRLDSLLMVRYLRLSARRHASIKTLKRHDVNKHIAHFGACGRACHRDIVETSTVGAAVPHRLARTFPHIDQTRLSTYNPPNESALPDDLQSLQLDAVDRCQ